MELSKNLVTIEGRGVTGWWKETSVLKYKGPKLTFLISPVMLADLVNRHQDCSISSTFLIVEGTSFKYVSCLGSVEDQ